MRFVFSLLLMILPLLGNAARADELSAKDRQTLFFGHDDRIRPDPRTAPWRSIGKLELGEVDCTATLVSARVVVTAAHCFLGNGRHLDKAIKFSAGFRDGTAVATARPVKVYVPRQLFKGLTLRGEDIIIGPTVAGFDYAFVALDRPIGAQTGFMKVADADQPALKARLDALHWRADQAGYAGDSENILTAHRRCRMTGLTRRNILTHRCDTLEGDSGSPIFVMDAGQPVLIAVQSSAPGARDRQRADNFAVAAPAFHAALAAFIKRFAD